MGTRRYQLRVPAEAASLAPVRDFLTAALAGALGPATAMAVLAVSEACANVIAHRTPKLGRDELELQCEVGPDLVRFRIPAFCAATDVASIRPRDLADLRPGGLGTHFIAEIMDRVVYEPDPDLPGAMALVLEKRNEVEPAP
jgi:sigma-B regulation protein RsbU (phosphoserine phosphatase)